MMFISKYYSTGMVFIKYKVSLFLKRITLCIYVKITKKLYNPEISRNRNKR